MDRMADIIGVTVGKILLPEITENEENVIDFIKDSERASVTFSQGRYKNQIKETGSKPPFVLWRVSGQCSCQV